VTHGEVADVVEAYESSKLGVKAFREIVFPGGRADVLSIRCSYKSSFTSIYECKATRADLLSDLRNEKWRIYTKFGRHVFYAFPPGLAEEQEIPEQLGIVHITDRVQPVRGSAVFSRQPDVNLLLSIIFNRMESDATVRKLKVKLKCPSCKKATLLLGYSSVNFLDVHCPLCGLRSRGDRPGVLIS